MLSIIFPQLVFHWKASKNQLKTFNYLIESAAAFIAIHSNIQALSYINEVESMVNDSESKTVEDSLFFISAEDKARVEFLKGQVSANQCFIYGCKSKCLPCAEGPKFSPRL